jgi:hypothetical protein
VRLAEKYKGYVIVDVAGKWDCECGCAESAGAGEV